MRRRGVYRDRTGVEGCQILRSDSQCKCIGFSEHRRRLWAIPAARIRALPRIFPRVADGNAEPRARRPRPRLSRCGVARARVKPDSGGAQSHDKPAVREAAARSRAIAEAPWEPWPQSSVETVTAQHIAAAARHAPCAIQATSKNDPPPATAWSAPPKAAARKRKIV